MKKGRFSEEQVIGILTQVNGQKLRVENISRVCEKRPFVGFECSVLGRKGE